MADRVDQEFMDKLIVACAAACVPKSGSMIVDVEGVAIDVCTFAEAIYARRQACIEERAKLELEERTKNSLREREDFQRKKDAGLWPPKDPRGMTGGMP